MVCSNLEQALELIRKNPQGMGLQIFQASNQKLMIKPSSPKPVDLGKQASLSAIQFTLLVSVPQYEQYVIGTTPLGFVKTAICLFHQEITHWSSLSPPLLALSGVITYREEEKTLCGIAKFSKKGIWHRNQEGS